jgi:DNA polymerase-3 subunit delta'
MAWNDVIGQHRVKQILQNSFVQDRVASAYLFVGNEGVGKDAIAIEFAKLLNDSWPSISENGINSKADLSPEFDKRYKENALFHQNIISVFGIPTPKVGSKDQGDMLSGLSEEQVQEIQEELAKKSKDNYYKMNIKGTLAIRVSQVRKIKQILRLSNSDSGKRVIIIFDAHLMNDEASNAILKSVEEPAENTVFILITHSPDFILSTIRSRCQLIKFDPLKNEEIKEYLLKNSDIDQKSLEIILPFANGSITRALEFADEELQSLRELSIELLRNGLRKLYREKTISIIESLCKENDRTKILKTLLIISFWLEDCLKKSVGSDNIINKDQEEIINKFADIYGSKDIPKAINYCEDSMRMVNQNVNLQMILISLIIKLRKIFM